jgi:hypothetical protein
MPKLYISANIVEWNEIYSEFQLITVSGKDNAERYA